jgi:hypothetical protein
MDYVELPAFMAALRERENSIAGRALEFLILTAARSNEVCKSPSRARNHLCCATSYAVARSARRSRRASLMAFRQ